ncbi:hypothetical protein [Aquifex aeolicus]|uniref:hypothetical protein n=1 Tax=Aquifex aeolicus TaxID=63363 RepID=UPI0002DD8CA9|nr:hypothetical protein [Aquifex aeolicus]
MVDADILLIAFVDTIEGVKNLIGERGAGAVLRDAGRHSGPKLLESLIGKLPEEVDKDTALKRTAAILKELGFADEINYGNGKFIIKNDVFTEAVREDVNVQTPVVYFLAGLVEGFVQFMSNDKVVLKPVKAEKGYVEFEVSP